MVKNFSVNIWTRLARLGLVALAALIATVVLDLTGQFFVERREGHVVRVLDGDSFIYNDGQKEQEVRIYGIDAPEHGQAESDRARQKLSDLIAGKEITVEEQKTDQFGRRVGRVKLKDGTNVAHRMIRDGYVWWARRFAPSNRWLREYEEEARKADRGIWKGEKDPEPPWVWRTRKESTKRRYGQ